MLFNSFDFAVFLPVVFILYWMMNKWNLKAQNLLIVIASYVFYGWWDWRFLSLILFSTLVDFFVGLRLGRTENGRQRMFLLLTSILVNLGLLGFFKYYNFFVGNFIDAFSFFGKKFDVQTIRIILPVGISFYTFQTLSYSIDVYRRKLQPTRDFVAFAGFVSFFPQLVAGPIERAANLLPQFFSRRTFDYEKATDGMKQILWGLFKKVVIADNCAQYVNMAFGDTVHSSGSTLLLGAILFAFQIYGDFSGYSDIAIGTARLFGFNLMRNFAFPYFSRDIAEFWRRWHISLSSWFRDYVYIPLGGSRGPRWKVVRNIFIIFIVSGFWHGANWTFIIWGALNALYFLPLLLLRRNRDNIEIVASNRLLPTFSDAAKIIFTFILTTLAWVFFRADNLDHAGKYLSGMASSTLFSAPERHHLSILLILPLFLLVEYIGRRSEYAIAHIGGSSPRIFRWSFYGLIIIAIGLFMQTSGTPFIYFQF